jgi:ribonuclease D
VITRTWIDSDEAFSAALNRHSHESRYALDTEFSTGRTYNTILAVVQIGFIDEIILVDATRVDLSPLRDLFSSSTLMLAHSALNDLDILDAGVGTRPGQLFDTQIAGSLIGYPQPSLALLASEILDVTLDKSMQRTDWLVRPLPEAALAYAASDVEHLFAIADRLEAQLQDQNRLEWMREECSMLLSRRRPSPAPEELWWHLQRAETIPRSRQIHAQRLCILRDQWAQKANKPPTVVLSDQAIVALCKKPPRRTDDVSRLGGNRGVERRFADAVLAIFQQPVTDGELHATTFTRLDEALSPLHTALAALANQRAIDIGVDPGLLASRIDVADYLNQQPSRLDTGWRRECIGDDFEQLRAGRAAIAVVGDRLKVRRAELASDDVHLH